MYTDLRIYGGQYFHNVVAIYSFFLIGSHTLLKLNWFLFYDQLCEYSIGKYAFSRRNINFVIKGKRSRKRGICLFWNLLWRYLDFGVIQEYNAAIFVILIFTDFTGDQSSKFGHSDFFWLNLDFYSLKNCKKSKFQKSSYIVCVPLKTYFRTNFSIFRLLDS